MVWKGFILNRSNFLPAVRARNVILQSPILSAQYMLKMRFGTCLFREKPEYSILFIKAVSMSFGQIRHLHQTAVLQNLPSYLFVRYNKSVDACYIKFLKISPVAFWPRHCAVRHIQPCYCSIYVWILALVRRRYRGSMADFIFRFIWYKYYVKASVRMTESHRHRRMNFAPVCRNASCFASLVMRAEHFMPCKMLASSDASIHAPGPCLLQEGSSIKMTVSSSIHASFMPI